MEQRKLKRIPVSLEASILLNNHSHAAHIINISAQGLPMIVSPGENAIELNPGSEYKLALADAGYTNKNVPPDRTGVVLGNTLTGEHSRSENMRLRWPYVCRILSNPTHAHDNISISLNYRQSGPL